MIPDEHINNKKTETIVLIHGFTQNKNIFNKQIDFFKDSYNLVLFDLRGHGESSWHDGPYGVEEYTDDLQDIFDKISLSNVIFWGTHTGTATALNLYLRNPKYISCMILEGTVIPGFDTPSINKNINRAREITASLGLEEAKEDWLLNSEWFDYMRKNPTETRYIQQQQIIKSFSGKPWKSTLTPKIPTNILSKIKDFNLPILAYNGENDMGEFFRMTDELKKNNNVLAEIIPNAGGFPLWENPEFVNQLVFKYLKNRHIV